MNISRIRINKNRGWRGLAEAVLIDEHELDTHKMIFSFSPAVWNDMLNGHIVMSIDNNFVIVNFNNTRDLPKPTQQRSVLIKNFRADVTECLIYSKTESWSNIPLECQHYIVHYLDNKNNHTTSDWNAIGMRVTPYI